jgi:CHAP domain
VKGAHLHRRPPLPMPVQACIFIAGLILFGAGIAIAAADDHPDGRVSSVTAQSTTTTIEPTTRTTVQEMTTTTAPRPVGRTAAPVRSYAFKATAATSTVLETTTTTETPTTPLEIAQSQVGKTGAYAEGGFWCAKFVSWIAEQAKVSGFISRDGPSALYADAVADRRLTQEPVVGGMIFIDLFGPNGIGHGQVTHVGIVASVTGDELVIIQGNGKPDPSVVTRTTYKIGDGFVIAFAPFSRETSEHSDD